MKTSSCKEKGRRLQQYVRDKILENNPSLEPDDVTSRSMGCSGSDILLSPKAQSLFGFDVECKNVEKLNVHEALKQCESNSKKNTPLLIFKKNHSKVYAVLALDDLFKLLNK